MKTPMRFLLIILLSLTLFSCNSVSDIFTENQNEAVSQGIPIQIKPLPEKDNLIFLEVTDLNPFIATNLYSTRSVNGSITCLTCDMTINNEPNNIQILPAFDISPNGKELAAFVGITELGQQSEDTTDGGLLIVNLHTGKGRIITNHRPHNLTWSPDGKYIAYKSPSGILAIIEVNNPSVFLAPNDTNDYDTSDSGDSTRLSWSPDSNQLVYDKFHEEIIIRDKSSPEYRQYPTALESYGDRPIYWLPMWSPVDSNILYISDLGVNRFNLFITNTDFSQQQCFTCNMDFYIVDAPSWSPDGEQILFVTLSWSSLGPEMNAEMWIVDKNGKNLREIAELPKQNVLSITQNYGFIEWSLDGKQLIFSAYDGKNSAIYTIGVNGVNPSLTCLTQGSNKNFIFPHWIP
jgi:Tol biopolymer transport system component